jgi:hypothetical protein
MKALKARIHGIRHARCDKDSFVTHGGRRDTVTPGCRIRVVEVNVRRARVSRGAQAGWTGSRLWRANPMGATRMKQAWTARGGANRQEGEKP